MLEWNIMDSMTRIAMIDEVINGSDGVREPVGAIFDEFQICCEAREYVVKRFVLNIQRCEFGVL